MKSAFLVLCIISTGPFALYLSILWLSRKSRSVNDSLTKNRITELSVILPCYNEEVNIERKINEIIVGCEFLDRFEIVVISDGSTDSTNLLLKQISAYNNVKVYLLKEREGKAHAINFGVTKTKYPIIVFSDARQTLEKGAICNLIKCLSDDKVGAVSAQLINGKNRSIIRSIINYLKMLESETGSTIGVYGSLYAIRKSCFINIPNNTILDDLLIPLQVNRLNKKVKFEKTAIVYDMDIESFYSSNRVLRISQGLIQIIRDHKELILDLPLRLIVYLFCQKYYKLFFPFILIAIIVFSLYIIKYYVVILIISVIMSTLLILIKRKEIKLIFRLFFISFLNLFKFGDLSNVKWKKL